MVSFQFLVTDYTPRWTFYLVGSTHPLDVKNSNPSNANLQTGVHTSDVRR